VAAGDVPDGEGHGEHGQAEGQRDPGQANADIRKGGGQYGTAATSENQPEGADAFSEIAAFHVETPRLLKIRRLRASNKRNGARG
jgi:hypothetical protein